MLDCSVSRIVVVRLVGLARIQREKFSTEADDAEGAALGQATHEEDQCVFGCLDPRPAHGPASIQQEDEVEVLSGVQHSCLRNLVLFHLEELLWSNRIECGYERSDAGHFFGVRTLGVEQLWNQHVSGTIVEVDLATWKTASHNHTQVAIITFRNFSVLWDAHATDWGLRDNADFVRELVREI